MLLLSVENICPSLPRPEYKGFVFYQPIPWAASKEAWPSGQGR